MKRLTAISACVVVVLSGCGTRATSEEVRAGAGGGTVSLSQQSIDQLRAATGAVPGTGAAAAPVGATNDRVDSAPAPDSGNAPAASAQAPKDEVTPRKSADTPASGAACTTPGAPVTLGQVGTFSGLVGPIFGDALLASAAWAKDVNARGGLACHPVTLYVREDGGDPARAAAAVRELIDQHKVAAFVGNQTALSGAGFFPEIRKACTPAVGLEYGPDWTKDPCLFPQGGGYYEQLAGIVKEAVDGGRTKLGLLYCVEIGACGAAGKLIEGHAKRFGAELAYSSPVSLTQPDFTAQCQNAKNAGVVELVVALEGSAMARLARSCLALDYRPLLSGTGLAVNPDQAADPKLRELGLMAVIANAPWFLTDLPGLKELRDVMARYAPQVRIAGSVVATWASVKLLEAGVARIGEAARTAPLTASIVLSGMNKVRGETLGGLTAPLDFTPANKGMRTSGCVFFAHLGADGFSAPRGGKPLCNVLP